MKNSLKEPELFNQILERDRISGEIKEILNSFEANCKSLNFKKGIYIYGSPGCGKTRFVMDLLNYLNYDVIKYDAGDVRNKSLIDTITSNNISNRNVLHLMSGKIKKIAIVMDEIDGMNNGDKGGITSLIKLIRQKKTKKQKSENVTLNPIICIGNYYIDKKIKELMKVCNVFELKTPTVAQINSIIQRTISIPLAPSLESKILDYIQGDLVKLEFIIRLYEKKPELLNEEILSAIFIMKSYNYDAKKITHSLINTPISLTEHVSFMNETDRTIVSLLYHENIIDTLQTPVEKMDNSPAVVLRKKNKTAVVAGGVVTGAGRTKKKRVGTGAVLGATESAIDMGKLRRAGDTGDVSMAATNTNEVSKKTQTGVRKVTKKDAIEDFYLETSSLTPLGENSVLSPSSPPSPVCDFYIKVLENICYADYIDRITFQNQIWVFNEMSSLIKTFYNNYIYHKTFPENMGKFQPEEVRFTKVLTKYSTEYNNQLFIYNFCQELNMDKRDMKAFFQELRLFNGNTFYNQTERLNHVMELFQTLNISKLDVKRMYRFLDKNVKIGGGTKVTDGAEDDDDDIDYEEL